MPTRTAGVVIDRLLTDQEFRDQFAEHPLEMLARLYVCAGIDLSVEEMAGLVLADPKVWSSSAGMRMGTIH